MAAYYNEIDLKTAAWLRELIKAGLIADGEVDTRSIVDVQASDLAGFVQCHFFAGIGGWSYALRLAGWPDDRHVWTGSCPCQPWSVAGKSEGADDPRHLWPAWFRLIEVCRPSVIFGEQVAGTDGLYWLDLVYRDLEASDYAIGATDLSGASLGSPDIRPRLWIVADTDGRHADHGHVQRGREYRLRAQGRFADGSTNDAERAKDSRLANTSNTERRPLAIDRADDQYEVEDRPESAGHVRERGAACGLDNTKRRGTGRSDRDEGRAEHPASRDGQDEGRRRLQTQHASASPSWLAHTHTGGQRVHRPASSDRAEAGEPHADECGTADGLVQSVSERSQGLGWDGNYGNQPGRHDSPTGGPSTAAGIWRDAEWIPCRDGKFRPVEPGAFPLVAGLPISLGRLSAAQRRLAAVAGLDGPSLTRARSNRTGRLRGYGNAIKPQVAKAFIEAYLDVRGRDDEATDDEAFSSCRTK